MLDIDEVIDGKPGSPRLSDLLAMAEKVMTAFKVKSDKKATKA